MGAAGASCAQQQHKTDPLIFSPFSLLKIIFQVPTALHYSAYIINDNQIVTTTNVQYNGGGGSLNRTRAASISNINRRKRILLDWRIYKIYTSGGISIKREEDLSPQHLFSYVTFVGDVSPDTQERFSGVACSRQLRGPISAIIVWLMMTFVQIKYDYLFFLSFSLPSSFRWLYSSRSVRPFKVVVRASGRVVTYICLHFDPFCTTLFCSRGHIAYRAFFFSQ